MRFGMAGCAILLKCGNTSIGSWAVIPFQATEAPEIHDLHNGALWSQWSPGIASGI